jgi:hypothetical protein
MQCVERELTLAMTPVYACTLTYLSSLNLLTIVVMVFLECPKNTRESLQVHVHMQRGELDRVG